ncbi:Y-family DNA polymerase [Woodsholea maritima]|uniref:Y-family DNA polymerase n=1 Tax=Woodsholea maritima TaxID=240237 RepID=UPI000369734C|nr:Y-family DNA polymerase [Woodsholea maritima]
MFALVDCNNFYVSCERAFNPGLKNKPVVVLSNNDGCVVSRSNEAKALDIDMAAPYFKIQKEYEACGGIACSSNYQLYGDMSARVMHILRETGARFEAYSIDEAFLEFGRDDPAQLTQLAHEVRDSIHQWTGIPVAFGLAPTKTLAKLANHVAKKNTGVFEIRTEDQRLQVLRKTELCDIWGIGRRLSRRLAHEGLTNAYDLACWDPRQARKVMGVVGERLLRELNGQPCLAISDLAPRQNILSSRSFGKLTSKKEDLAEAMACYSVRACEKLRRQNSLALGVYAFISTPRHGPQPFHEGLSYTLPAPTQDSAQIIKITHKLLDRIFQPGLKYQKCGVMLLNLVQVGEEQLSLLAPAPDPRQARLMATLDHINHRDGRNTIFYGAQGIERKHTWAMRCGRRSPRYTTQWSELPKVYAR